MNEYVKRYFWLTVGLFIMAIGVGLSTKANLGTSPVSCVPYVLSLSMPLSMGTLTIITHVIFILLQIILLRRDYEFIQLLQLVVAFVFGYFTDLSLWLLRDIHITTYPAQWFLCLFSCVIIAFGVNLEVKAGVVMLAGEGLMSAISKVFHIEFGKVKIGFDISQVIIGVAFSFFAFGNLQGIREGTIAAAILVGVIVGFINRNLSGIYRYLGLHHSLKDSLNGVYDDTSTLLNE